MRDEFLINENNDGDYANVTLLGYGKVEMFDEDSSENIIDEIELQISNFNKEYDEVNKKIIDISSKLIIEIGLCNFTEEVDKLTNKVKILDDNIDDIRNNINFFGRTSEFSVIFSELVDSIIQIKERLKTLKILQVTLYESKIEYINKKIDELKKIVDSLIEEKFVDMINCLEKVEKTIFEVTDWKFSKHRNINYEKINEFCENISVIEDGLGYIKVSQIEEKLDCYKKVIDSKISSINIEINNAVFLDSVNIVKSDLNNLDNLMYSFLTMLYLNKGNISNNYYILCLKWVNECKKVIASINELLITNKKYKNNKEELTYMLKNIDTKIDIFSRYVDIHCVNGNNTIVTFDEEELLVYSKELEKIINDIKFTREQLVESQYNRLMVISFKMMNKLDEIRNKINNAFKINLQSLYSVDDKFDEMFQNDKKNDSLKVMRVRSGKKILEKHNKLVLISAGLISLVLLLRKFLLIPTIMYGNVKLGNIYLELNSTIVFFNRILGSMISATISTDGVWYLANGSLLNSEVVSTSLLKGLVTGSISLETSVISTLVILIKELVDKMKIKDHKQNLIKNINMMQEKYDSSIESVIE